MLFPGELSSYFNLSSLLGEHGKVLTARYNITAATKTSVRTAAVSNKFKVMTLVVKKNLNATHIDFLLEYHKEDKNTTLKVCH